MTKTITGTIGINFDITETNDSLTVGGDIEHQIKVPDAIASLTLTDSDIVAAAYGTVGTTAFDVDMNDLDDDSGTGYTMSISRNQNVDYTTLKGVIVYNSDDTNNLKFGNSSANGFLTWEGTDNFLTLPPGAAILILFSTALTLSTNGKFNLVADGSDTDYQLYFMGA